jgi:hypothetical protein
VAALDRRCADLQVGNSELRKQLGQALEETRRGLPPEAANRLAALEQIVSQKETELHALRGALLQREQELAAAAGVCYVVVHRIPIMYCTSTVLVPPLVPAPVPCVLNICIAWTHTWSVHCGTSDRGRLIRVLGGRLGPLQRSS